MSRKPTATHADLVRTLSYNAETGRFGVRPLMTSIGWKLKNGYVMMYWGGKEYHAHRLAWFYVHGEFPPEGMHLDHINGDKADNRIANLRMATPAENAQNRRTIATGASLNDRGTWSARITISGRTKHLGRYPTQEQAHAAYLAARAEAHPFALPSARTAAA